MNLPRTLAALQRALGERDRSATARLVAHLLADRPHESEALHAAGLALLAGIETDLAVTCLAAACASGEANADRWNDYGVALQRGGRTQRAAAAFRNALEQRPGDPTAAGNLATLLFAAGAYDEAYRLAQHAHHARPDALQFATTLALLEGVLCSHERALARLDGLLLREPGDATALAARTQTLRKLERFPEALEAATHLAAVAPDDAAADATLGAAFRDAGQLPEAFAAYDRAIARSALPAAALAGKGDALLDAGDLDAAEDHFARAVATDPACAAGWFGLAQLRPLSARERTTLEALAATSGHARHEARILASFALGRALVHVPGAEERAVAAFDAGNTLARAAFRYDVARDESRATAIVAAFDEGTLRRLSAAAGEASRAAPIFIVGMPRSGTSLLEAILAAHPAVAGAGELPLARRAIEERAPYPQSLIALDAHDVAAIGRRYVASVADAVPGGRRVVDKMPSNFLYAGLLHAMLPHARIIHCERDALDTTWSCYAGLFAGRQDFAYEQTELGRYWRAYRRVMDHWRATLPAHAMLHIRYEHVVTDFDATVARMLDFCGLPWSDACRAFATTQRAVATASRVEVRRPLFRTSVGGARRFAPYLRALVAALNGA